MRLGRFLLRLVRGGGGGGGVGRPGHVTLLAAVAVLAQEEIGETDHLTAVVTRREAEVDSSRAVVIVQRLTLLTAPAPARLAVVVVVVAVAVAAAKPLVAAQETAADVDGWRARLLVAVRQQTPAQHHQDLGTASTRVERMATGSLAASVSERGQQPSLTEPRDDER